jgi:hypothetical protein
VAVVVVLALQAIQHQFHACGNAHLVEDLENIISDEVGQNLRELYLRDVRAAYRQAGVAGLVKKAGRIRLTHMKRLFHKIASSPSSQVPPAPDQAASGAGHD